MPLGGVRHAGRNKANPLKGFPDLFGVLKRRSGVMFAIEVKTEKGMLSPEQLTWFARLDALGCAVCVARSAEQAMSWLAAVDA